MKPHYSTPKAVRLGSITELTAAIGGGAKDDQSDFPAQFPPNSGSFDVCKNDTQGSTC